MKALSLLLSMVLLAAACGSSTPAGITDATTLEAGDPGHNTDEGVVSPQSTTAAPALFRYEVSLTVDYRAYTRVVGHGGIPTEYHLTYTTSDELLFGDVMNVAEGFPADATVAWTRNCYSAVMGPDVELQSSAEGSLPLEIPNSEALVPFDFAGRYSTVDWLAPPATSLSSLSGAIAVLYRLPSTLSLGEEANCGDPGPKVVIPDAGHAWMTAQTISVADGELMSPAAAMNLTRGSEDPGYILDGDGVATGWLIALIDHGDAEAGPVPIEFTKGEASELGGWDLTVTGEIRPIDD